MQYHKLRSTEMSSHLPELEGLPDASLSLLELPPLRHEPYNSKHPSYHCEACWQSLALELWKRLREAAPTPPSHSSPPQQEGTLKPPPPCKAPKPPPDYVTDGKAGSVRCFFCGKRYSREDIVASQELNSRGGDSWVVNVCRKCGNQVKNSE